MARRLDNLEAAMRARDDAAAEQGAEGAAGVGGGDSRRVTG